jgi:hypothetical protein
MLGEQQAKEKQMALQNLIGQIVSRQVAVAMQSYGIGINQLAVQVQMQMLMMDTIRRLLEEKGIITKEEFEEQAQKLQEMTQRSHEISHDMEMDRDERVKKLVEECGLDEKQAEGLVDEVAKRMSGTGVEGLVGKEEEGESEDAPEEDTKEEEETPDESGSEEQAAASGAGDDQAGGLVQLP